MSGWAWLVAGAERLGGASAAAEATDKHGKQLWVQGFPAGARPHPAAVRVDRRVFDPRGEAARVSLVLLEEQRCPLFDDPAVSQALRDVLSGPAVDAVSTLTRDPVHCAGGVTIVRDGRDLRDDPFRRLGAQRVLAVGPGVFGRSPLTVAPVTQRYAGQPWPADRFDGAA